MFTRTKRYLYLPTVVLVLSVSTLALLPALAEAQVRAPVDQTGSGTYVVQPGDTLSAIAAGLGTTVEDLAASNGIADPDLIYAGQELRYPLEPAAREQEELAAKPAPKSAQPPKVASQEEPVPDRADNPAALPEPPAVEPVPKVGSLPAESAPALPLIRPAKSAISAVSSAAAALVESLSEGTYIHRRLLSMVLLVLNFGLLLSFALLVAQKWRGAYGRNYAYYFDPFGDVAKNAPRRATPAPKFERSPVDHENGAAAEGKRPRHVGIFAFARRRRERIRREQRLGPERPPREPLTTGVHNPEVRRLLGRPQDLTLEEAAKPAPKGRRRMKTRNANGGRQRWSLPYRKTQ